MDVRTIADLAADLVDFNVLLIEVCSRAHVLLEYYPWLVFKSGDYFFQHGGAATIQEQRPIEQIRYLSVGCPTRLFIDV